jgi:hypothetical protein
MRDRQPWSAEDDALLNSLAGDGLSASRLLPGWGGRAVQFLAEATG